MGRHAQNNTDRSFHTYDERQKAGYGTKKIRLGKESQLKFGQCGLRLTPAENPLVSPHGHIFSKDAIVEFLSEQRNEIKRHQEAYDAQERKRKQEEVDDSDRKKRQKIEELELDARRVVAPQIHKELDSRKEATVNVGFWVPGQSREAKKSALSPAPKTTTCPLTNKPLRFKDMFPVNLEWDKSKEQVLCAVSKKPITFQKVLAIKPSGIVVLESVFDEIVKPTMTCPLTNKKLTSSDIVSLVPGGSGFCAHSKVEATSYHPNI